MTRGVLIVEVVAVHRDFVTDRPVANGRAGAKNDARSVGTNDVKFLRVTTSPHRLFAKAIKESEGRQWFEDRSPHCVEVDGRGHDRNRYFVGCQLRQRNLVNLQTLSRVLVGTGHTLEHVLILATYKDGTSRCRHGQAGQSSGIGSGADSIKDFTHAQAG